MTTHLYKAAQKRFLIKVYPSLGHIDTAIKFMVQNDANLMQISILGKAVATNKTTPKKLNKIKLDIKEQLSLGLRKNIECGYFKNPDIGVIFIAGHLTNIFLYLLDKKKLASLPAGLQGIFQGLQVDREHIISYLTHLKNQRFLLIIRGEQSTLVIIDQLLHQAD